MNDDERIWIKSYDHFVNPDMQIPDISFVGLMDRVFHDFSDQPACHFMGNTMTYAQLDLFSRKFAAFLADAGLKKGDVVGINLPNIPQYLIALMGTLRAGCVQSGVSPLLTGKEIAEQLFDCGAKVIVTLDAIFEHRLAEVLDQIPTVTYIVVANLGESMPFFKRTLGRLLRKIPSGRVAPVSGKTVTGFPDVLAKYHADKLEVGLDPQDTCLIQYTGGTTGKPKGAELSHRNVVASTTHFQQWCDLVPGKDIFLTGFPLFHIGGLFCGMSFLMNACPQVLIPDPRNTKHIIAEMARYKPTGVGNVPSLYQMLLAEPGFKKLSFAHVKGLVSGAAPFSAETINQLESVVGKGKISDVYGMTETCATISMTPFRGRKKPGSVGVPMQNTRVKLTALDGGSSEVPLGQPGEIIVRGPQVMKGYHNRPGETADSIREFQGETWFYTGDVGVMDEEGFLTIVDRTKDMINVSGYKVFSKEVEEKILAHPAVELCALIGVKDPQRPGSEQVKAVIQLKKTFKDQDKPALEQDLLQFCKKNMAAYKVPHIIQFTDAIPLTAVGKVNKKILKG